MSVSGGGSLRTERAPWAIVGLSVGLLAALGWASHRALGVAFTAFAVMTEDVRGSDTGD